MTVSQERLERLEARVTRRQKALLKRAATIRGRSLTDFVVSAAEEAAERVIRSEFVISLGAEESANPRRRGFGGLRCRLGFAT